MKVIMKNNFRRLLEQKQIIVLLVLFTAAASCAAVFVSTWMTQKWDVAVVSPASAELASKQVNIIQMEEAPPRSELVMGRYDAVLTKNADGSCSLETVKSEEITAKLKAALEGREDAPAMFSDRGTGTNVLGFLTMFLLMMGSTCMTFYADDKTGGQITRIAASPLGISNYLFAHCLFNFLFLFIPTTIILVVVKWISGAAFGFGFLPLAGMLALICALSTVFSLFLYSMLPNKDDSAKMIGNTIIILTSILAGGFFAFDKGNQALGVIIQILPQKAFLNVADGVEQHMAWQGIVPSLTYLLLLIAVFYTVSVWKTKRTYIGH